MDAFAGHSVPYSGPVLTVTGYFSVECENAGVLVGVLTSSVRGGVPVDKLVDQLETNDEFKSWYLLTKIAVRWSVRDLYKRTYSAHQAAAHAAVRCMVSYARAGYQPEPVP
jgi:hypothetical protein